MRPGASESQIGRHAWIHLSEAKEDCQCFGCVPNSFAEASRECHLPIPSCVSAVQKRRSHCWPARVEGGFSCRSFPGASQQNGPSEHAVMVRKPRRSSTNVC